MSLAATRALSRKGLVVLQAGIRRSHYTRAAAAAAAVKPASYTATPRPSTHPTRHAHTACCRATAGASSSFAPILAVAAAAAVAAASGVESDVHASAGDEREGSGKGWWRLGWGGGKKKDDADTSSKQSQSAGWLGWGGGKPAAGGDGGKPPPLPSTSASPTWGSVERRKAKREGEKEDAAVVVDKIGTAIDDFLQQAVDRGAISKDSKASVGEYGAMLQDVVPAFSGGMVAGVCAGYAVKKVTRAAALAVGLVICGAQAASYFGYVDVKYEKVQDMATELLDLDKDGKVDGNDLRLMYERVLEVLNHKVPAGTGFGAGVVLGLRLG